MFKGGIDPKVKKLLILAANFIVIFGIYQLFLAYEIIAVMYLYSAAASVLIVAYFVINRGIESKKPEAEELSDRLSEEKKRDYLENFDSRHARAIKILYVLFPLLLTLIIDWIVLMFA